MANTSLTVPDELVEEFDRKITEMEYEGEFPNNTSRSRVIRELMEMWVEGEVEVSIDEGNLNQAVVAAD